jgi:hypothetical protein
MEPHENTGHNILSDNFQCGICQGYIIDAMTITECLHSCNKLLNNYLILRINELIFIYYLLVCRSCIVFYLETSNNKCPTCNIALENVADAIKPDSILQRIIYKLNPNVLVIELDRRRKFCMNSASTITTTAKNHFESILQENTIVNIRLISSTHSSHSIKHNNHLKRLISKSSKENIKMQDVASQLDIRNRESPKLKYIQCIANMPLRILTKLLKKKYNIPAHYQIKFSYLGYKLDENETFLEIFTSLIKRKVNFF